MTSNGDASMPHNIGSFSSTDIRQVRQKQRRNRHKSCHPQRCAPTQLSTVVTTYNHPAASEHLWEPVEQQIDHDF
jgi:hypothetical protein